MNLRHRATAALAAAALLSGLAAAPASAVGSAPAPAAPPRYDSCGVEYGKGWYAPWGKRNATDLTAHTFAVIGCPLYRWGPSWMGFR